MDRTGALVRAILDRANTGGWTQLPKFGGHWSEDEIHTEVGMLVQAGLLEGTKLNDDECRPEKSKYKIVGLTHKGREHLEKPLLGSN